jgi:predicted Zn-dependent peptidase
MFVVGAAVDHLLAGKFLNDAKEVMTALAAAPVSVAELEQARTEILSARNKQLATPDGLANSWLDIDTYGVASSADEIRAINALTPNDLQRVANRLFRDTAIASIAVGNSDLVKTSVERFGKVELIGEVGSRGQVSPNQSSGQSTIKPATKPE